MPSGEPLSLKAPTLVAFGRGHQRECRYGSASIGAFWYSRIVVQFFAALFPKYRKEIEEGSVLVVTLSRRIYRYADPVTYPGRRQPREK